jgi:hypothetical protein
MSVGVDLIGAHFKGFSLETNLEKNETGKMKGASETDSDSDVHAVSMPRRLRVKLSSEELHLLSLECQKAELRIKDLNRQVNEVGSQLTTLLTQQTELMEREFAKEEPSPGLEEELHRLDLARQSTGSQLADLNRLIAAEISNKVHLETQLSLTYVSDRGESGLSSNGRRARRE